MCLVLILDESIGGLGRKATDVSYLKRAKPRFREMVAKYAVLAGYPRKWEEASGFTLGRAP